MEHILQTPCGQLRGTAGRLPGTVAYKGIRYATAGRWEYPKPVTHWEGVYDATQYAACSYQPRAFYDESKVSEKAFYYNEFRKGEHYDYSEDCLFLNVWTPEGVKPGDGLPVLFYIHGGGFTGGCGHEKHFDGPVWPAKGVIGVTINYRLGPLGFATLPELKEEAGVTGNYGLYDQVAALQWIHSNISAFGGDPQRVTVMGQSAGAMSVQHLCFSPLTDGLLAQAVMSSGGGVSKVIPCPGPEKGYDFWHAVMERGGCETLADFRALPAEQLFKTWQAAKKDGKGGSCFPCVDGKLVTGTGAELWKAGKQKDIPYLCGSTSEDVMPPFMYGMAKNWCQRQRRPSYAWFFDRQLPGDKAGAWHSSDLWYWFGTLDNCWRPLERKDWDLCELMTDYLCNFVKTGTPNAPGLPVWDPASKDRQVLCMGEEVPHMGRAKKATLWHTMFTNKAVGE